MRIGRAMSLYRLFRTSASFFPLLAVPCQIDCVEEVVREGMEVICRGGRPEAFISRGLSERNRRWVD